MAFRSAILQQQPLLLSAMLEKAVGSESGYEKVLSIFLGKIKTNNVVVW